MILIGILLAVAAARRGRRTDVAPSFVPDARI
jgi:hypothetical protein